MQILDGKKIAEQLLAELKQKPVPQQFLAGVLVGNDPASESFQRLKEKTARSLGVDYRIYRFSDSETNESLRKKTRKFNKHNL